MDGRAGRKSLMGMFRAAALSGSRPNPLPTYRARECAFSAYNEKEKLHRLFLVFGGLQGEGIKTTLWSRVHER
jgi:hypothetical protein